MALEEETPVGAGTSENIDVVGVDESAHRMKELLSENGDARGGTQKLRQGGARIFIVLTEIVHLDDRTQAL